MDDIKFTGVVSRLFDRLEEGDFEALKHLTILQSYGEFGVNESGEAIAYFQWDGGGRKLACYEEDGSLFLVQTSEIHGEENITDERDWFQVSSRQQAEWINRNWNGHQLYLRYQGPHIWTQEGAILFRRAKGKAPIK